MGKQKILDQVQGFAGTPEEIRQQAEALAEYQEYKKDIEGIIATKTEEYVLSQIEAEVKSGKGTLAEVVEHTWGLRRYKVFLKEMVDAVIVRGIGEIEQQIADKNLDHAEKLYNDLTKLYVEDDRLKEMESKLKDRLGERQGYYENAQEKLANEDLDGALAELDKIAQFDITYPEGTELKSRVLQRIQRKKDLKNWTIGLAGFVALTLLTLFVISIFRTTGTIVIFSDPVGANIFLDGDFEGVTIRQGLEMDILTGKRHLRLQKPSYKEREKELDIAEDGRDTIRVTLEKKKSELKIISVPPGAKLFMEGEDKGVCPFHQEDIKRGKYSIVLDLEGYYRAKGQVEVFAGRTTLDTIKMMKKPVLKKNELVSIPGGRFMMGSISGPKDEQPRHEVELSRFRISRYEVTIEQYKDYLNADKNAPDYHVEGINKIDDKWEVWEGYENYPVQVDWYRARAFCQFYGYKLPTEAQWEYACRGGTGGRWHFDPNKEKLEDYAWVASNTPNKKVQSVGQKKPNRLGLYDMYGNVSEWCNDWYFDWVYGLQKENEPCKNPPLSNKKPYDPSKRKRVRRGGNVRSSASEARSAARGYTIPETNRLMGFRYVK